MANRYWVGGTATWDGTVGTKWAASSGGPGGESIPGPNDDVFFDANSTGTVTIGAVNNGAKSIDCTGFTGTITGTGNLTVGGNITLSAGMTYSHTGTITITGTTTLTTAGKSFSALNISGSGITVTLGDALNISTRTLTLTSGTFTTNNFAVTAGLLSSTGTQSRTFNLGSSTVTLNGSGITAQDTTNLTFNAGTSQINLTGTTGNITVATLAGSGFTFYNVSFSATAPAARFVRGSHTFNNLTLEAPTSSGATALIFGADQTVNGTLTCAGSSFSQRGMLRSDVPGTVRTLTVATISANDCDFASITLAGAAAGATPTRAGDCGGNSGITFPAAKTVYRVGGNTTWAGNNSWALSSGGSGSDANFPLAQDTAVIDNSATTGITLSFSAFSVGTLDASARTNAITLSHGGTVFLCGSYTLGSGVTISGTSFVNLIAPVTSTFTTAGKSITFPLTIDNLSGTVSLADAYSSTAAITLTGGTFTTNNFNVTASEIFSTNSNSRTINFGSSTVTISNTFNTSTSTNLTLNAGTSQINITSSAAIFNSGTSLTFYNVSFTSTSIGTRAILGSATFNNLTLTAPSADGMAQLSIGDNQTVSGTLTCAGNTAVRRAFLFSGVSGAIRTLTVAAISANDCDFRDITLAGAAAGAAPTRAGDCGNNSGITFPAAKTVYRVGTNTTWAGSSSWATSSGGTGADTNFPLAQDTAIIDNATALAGTLSMQTFNIGTLDASARTGALTLAHTSSVNIARSYILGSGINITGTLALIFTARSGFAELTSAGKTITCPITVALSGATFRPLDALNIDQLFTMGSGTTDFNGYNVTCLAAGSGGTNTRTVALGASTLTITGSGTPWNVSNTTGLTLTGSGTISLTSASAKIFAGGGASYPYTINNGGAGALTITGSNTFTTLSNTVQPTTFTFRSGETNTVTNWNISGTAGNLVTINSLNNITNNTPPVLSKSSGTVSADYLAITFSNATGGASWYAGANSVDNGVNTGWIFTVPPPPGPATGNNGFFFLMAGW